MESPYAANTWNIDQVIKFFGTREEPAPGKVFASPDLCQYDMKEPGSDKLYWKKRVTLAATYPELSIVQIQCAKRPEDREHEHVIVRGSVKTPEGWKTRASLSSRYPSA